LCLPRDTFVAGSMPLRQVFGSIGVEELPNKSRRKGDYDSEQVRLYAN